jgi:DNA-binding MarR family transcriptional regulator
MSTERSDETTSEQPQDSVDFEADDWLAELPGVDAGIEAARMRLLRLARQAERMLSEIATQHELTLGDWETLSVLRRSGEPYTMTPSELMAALKVTSGTVSVRIERLLQAGLVEPASATADGRSRPVCLTIEGKRRWRAATDARTQFEQRLFQRALAPEQIAQLNTLLRALMTEWEAELGLPPRRTEDRGD